MAVRCAEERCEFAFWAKHGVSGNYMRAGRSSSAGQCHEITFWREVSATAFVAISKRCAVDRESGLALADRLQWKT